MKKLCTLLLAGLTTLGLVSCGGGTTTGGPTKTITLDGGGDIGNFNTTPSMTPSTANPYPYNTLEKLCEEWEAKNPGYDVVINRTSSNGDRTVLLPQLKAGTAPDIIYQNGSVVNTDLGLNYYVDLTDYLDSPNPYLENNAKWSTVYNADELAVSQAADGKYYYINMEKIPVCFMYNKTLLANAGVSNPESISTFGQLVAAMDKVASYAASTGSSSTISAYSTTYTWYQIAIESNLFSSYTDEGDVLRENGIIDTEELCRLYAKEIWKPTLNAASESDTFEGNELYEYIKLIAKLDENKAPASYDTRANWLNGNLAFMEATGAELRTLSANSNIDFEWGTIPFPDVTKEDSSLASKPCVRGTAGLATSWWVTNTAVKGEKVDACVDLLMFLTAPEQNNRLIGDLKGGIPLNPADDYELASYLSSLLTTYDSDIAELEAGNRVNFQCFNSWAVLGTEYQNLFIRTMQELDAGTTTVEKATATLAKNIKNAVASYRAEFEYDETKW